MSRSEFVLVSTVKMKKFGVCWNFGKIGRGLHKHRKVITKFISLLFVFHTEISPQNKTFCLKWQILAIPSFIDTVHLNIFHICLSRYFPKMGKAFPTKNRIILDAKSSA